MILAIYCAGGLGKEVLNMARWVNKKRQDWQEIILVDDVTEEKICHGARIYKFEEIPSISESVEFIIANGEPSAREKLYNKVKEKGYALGKLIEPSTLIFPGVKIGEGCIIHGGNIISADVTIGDNVFINTGVIVGHDTKIAEHSVVSARCFIGGKSLIERKAFLAPGAMIKDRVKVGEAAVVSLGAVILRNVRPKAIMVGNPAKRLGVNDEGKVFGMFD